MTANREIAMVNFANARVTRRTLLTSTILALCIPITSLTRLAIAQPAPAQPRTQNIDDFFRDFTAEWVRSDPDLARWTRYFSAAEQDRLERQITPRTLAQFQAQIERARQGLAALAGFDRAAMTETQRVSADLMQWQLKNFTDGAPFVDHWFPLNQFGGENIGLVIGLTIAHPLQTERDAENYVAALGQVGTRMTEATAEARRVASRGILPPRFILRATIDQMQRFAG